MKFVWQTCMAIVVTAAMSNAANAQWNDSEKIGSYQAILARAGYGGPAASQLPSGTPVGYNSAQGIPAPPGAAMAAPQAGVQANGGMMMAGTGCADAGVTSDCGCGGICGAPNCGGRLRHHRMRGCAGAGCSAGNCGTGTYLDAGSDGANCGAPVYNPETSVSSQVFEQSGSGNANWVVGLFGVSFRRDYEDNVRLGCTCGGAGADFYSRDVENGDMAGGGVSFTRRGCNGVGLEAVFWGLDQEDDVTIAGPTQTWLTGLGAVAHPPSGATVEDIFDAGDSVRLYRDTDIFNFEFNVLRNGGQYTTCLGRCANYELLAGFRLFNFDESLRYVSSSSTPGYPATIEYGLEANNSLAGFQLGGRSEVCLTDRWSFAYSGTAGVFNNYIETRQQIVDSNGYWALDYSDTKNDAAMIGQIDLGLIFQLSSKLRARGGYRAMGVSGVALAADQIPYDFTDTTALSSANSNGSLLLYGWYYGGEFCF